MEVRLPQGLTLSGVVMLDQIRSIDRKARHLKIVGRVPRDVLDEIDAKLAPFLSL